MYWMQPSITLHDLSLKVKLFSRKVTIYLLFMHSFIFGEKSLYKH